MLSISFLWIAVYISTLVLSKKGACDQTRECVRYTFTETERAVCLGYYGCKAAVFEGDKAVCSGLKSCFRGQFDGTQDKVICNGFSACERARGTAGISGLNAISQISCNGLKACNAVVGGLNANKVQCDGDITCTNLRARANTAMNLNGGESVYCNGNGACKGSIITANTVDGFVYCDGDVACKDSPKIEAYRIECQGKRTCKDSTLKANMINAYGFMGAGSTVIRPADTTKPVTIKAYGFKSLVKAEISSMGSDMTIQAYGYKALAGSLIDCGPNSQCTLECKAAACRNVPVYVATNAQLTMDPAECLDASSPRKVKNTFCPLIYLNQRPPVSEADLPEEFLDDREQIELEIAEYDEIADREFDEYINDRLAEFAGLPNYDEDDEEDESKLLFDDGLSVGTGLDTTNLIFSNLITGLIVFGITGGAAFCVVQYKYKDQFYKQLPM